MNRRGFVGRVIGGALALLGIGTAKSFLAISDTDLLVDESRCELAIDADGKWEIVQKGRVMVPLGFYDKEGEINGSDLQRLGDLCKERIRPLPNGFVRVKQEHEIRFDGRCISWLIVDREV